MATVATVATVATAHWPTVYDADPTVNQRWPKVSCLLKKAVAAELGWLSLAHRRARAYVS